MTDKTPCEYLCEHADLWCVLYCNQTDGKPDEACCDVYRNRKELDHD